MVQRGATAIPWSSIFTNLGQLQWLSLHKCGVPDAILQHVHLLKRSLRRFRVRALHVLPADSSDPQGSARLPSLEIVRALLEQMPSSFRFTLQFPALDALLAASKKSSSEQMQRLEPQWHLEHETWSELEQQQQQPLRKPRFVLQLVALGMPVEEAEDEQLADADDASSV